MLFLQPRALFAQLVDHAVVHAHELIHFRLAHFDELAGKIALADEFGPRADQIERHPKVLDQAHADGKGQDEECFNPQQPKLFLAQQVPSKPREYEVDTDQVEDEFGAQAQGSIPYFSKRRYSAARLKPNAWATRLMLPW